MHNFASTVLFFTPVCHSLFYYKIPFFLFLYPIANHVRDGSKPQRPQARGPALIAVLLSLAGEERPGPREVGVMICSVMEATLGNRATAITQITKFSKGHTQVYLTYLLSTDNQ
jgi:hypothetical protein